MTRKEIEKRCLEEMQQTIPDPEALWQRIEANLPEQPAETPETPVIRMHHRTRRIMTIAACLLLVITGARVLTQTNSLKNETSSDHMNLQEDVNAPAMDEQQNAAEEWEEPMQTVNKDASSVRTYASLGLPSEQRTVVTDAAKLTAGTQLFAEQSVLAQTECFVDVIVSDGRQSETTGEIVYLLKVVDAYGTDALTAGESFYLYSSTPYVLQPGHEYVLPLYASGTDAWELVNASAPQIELTPDGEMIFHNGWHSLQNGESTPLLCAQYGTDDYFYDRMYIAQDAVLYQFLENWEASL